MNLTNKDLWDQLRTGKINAIEDLFRLNYQVLYSYAFKICRNKEMSKDCVQELFIQLWEKRKQLKDVTNVRSYLLQSIWNALIRKMKKGNNNIRYDENSHYNIEIVFPKENIIIESQSGREISMKLTTALKNLTDRQKQIIFMQYYEGLSIDEIREITALKYQSIKNLTYRAMLSLRKSLQSKKNIRRTEYERQVIES